MAPPTRKHRSLFGEILDWMLAPLLLLWPLSVLLTWLVAQGLANQPFDRIESAGGDDRVLHGEAISGEFALGERD